MGFWTKEEDARLLRMRSERIDYVTIADAIGRSKNACCKRFQQIEEHQRIIAAGETPNPPRAFTADEVATLLRMRDVERATFVAIDRALNRGDGASKAKYRQLQAQPLRPRDIVAVERVAPVPNAQIADRDARYALSHSTITAELFGDPLPGRSALDQRLSRQTPA